MPKLPFSAFAVGVIASTYATLCMADKAGERADVFTFPRRNREFSSPKDYDQVRSRPFHIAEKYKFNIHKFLCYWQVLRERVYLAKNKQERQEVAVAREAYNGMIKATKGYAEEAFKVAEEGYKAVEDLNPFK